MRIVGFIPVRKGSERVPSKNTRPFAYQTLLTYAIRRSLRSKYLDQIYVNSDCDLASKIAKIEKAEFFRRRSELCSGEVTLDHFTYDFVQNVHSDIVIMINPVCPLVDLDLIDKLIDQFNHTDTDAIITATDYSLHGFFNNVAINFNPHLPLPKTQDIQPITICNWAYAIWSTKQFKSYFIKNGRGVFLDRLQLYKIPPEQSIKISTIEEFNLAEKLFLLHELHLKYGES